MNKILFSVIIPSYNREHEVLIAIDSVIKQTIQDYEIIVVDDGSNDGTRDAVLSLNNPKIRYIYQTNAGGAKARNTGIKNAKGRYIAFLDSDDIYLPHHLENAKPILLQGNNVCTYTQVIVNRGDGVNFLKPHRALKEGEAISEYLMCDRGFVQTSTLIVPVEMFHNAKYDETISAGQDYDIAIKLAYNGAKFIMLTKAGAIWNDEWSENRLSSKGNPVQRMAWLNRIRPLITRKAYFGDAGWPVAKAFAAHGKRGKAAFLYFKALMNFCYRPKMAVVIGLQVLLPKYAYRVMSDFLVRFGLKP